MKKRLQGQIEEEVIRRLLDNPAQKAEFLARISAELAERMVSEDSVWARRFMDSVASEEIAVVLRPLVRSRLSQVNLEHLVNRAADDAVERLRRGY